MKGEAVLRDWEKPVFRGALDQGAKDKGQTCWPLGTGKVFGALSSHMEATPTPIPSAQQGQALPSPTLSHRVSMDEEGPPQGAGPGPLLS